jgi:hypothetical protein
LKIGLKNFDIVVKAENGTTIRTYSIAAARGDVTIYEIEA